MRQVIRVLELYFSQLDSRTPNNAQKYTADAFVGGSFTGTNITATNVDTAFLSFDDATGNTLVANDIETAGLSSIAHSNYRQISSEIMANAVYANTFYGDGKHINVPFNQFQSTSDQTAPNIATANALTYDTADFLDGITLSNSSRINVTHEGIYRFDYSISFENTINDRVDIDIWFRKNNNDIANSNSRFSIQARKSAGNPSYLIAVTPYMIELAANDYIEIMWRVGDIGVSIQHLPAVTASAGVTPNIPATPSVLLSAQFVSAKSPPPVRVTPLPVFGFGQIGNISVFIR